MKLLNRDPTEEMLKTTSEADGYMRIIWRCMYDAAPELTVDMEPFGYIGKAACDLLELNRVAATTVTKHCAFTSDTKIYSANQLAANRKSDADEIDALLSEKNTLRNKLATLQAENEQLMRDVDHVVGQALEHQIKWQDDVEKLTAERDELIEALRFYADGNHFVLHEPNAWETVSGEPQNFQEDESNTATIEDGSIAKQAIAKHEGEKHAD